MDSDNQTTAYKPGMRVEWGSRETAVGTLVAQRLDEDTGEVELCGEDEDGDHDPAPCGISNSMMGVRSVTAASIPSSGSCHDQRRLKDRS